ncbi:phosphomevalonate kinase [Mortierella claussenii]|nr:phosphomevalonate kinase [Mortierella claussenii]
MATSNTTIVSAPGKVLLAGGYLVLDPTFSGLVIATDARFYTLIRPGSKDNRQGSSPERKITVRSPQFENATWNYHVTAQDKDVQVSASAEDESKNTFVELALVYSLAILGHLLPASTIEQQLDSGLEIVIAGNNDFYSQRKELEKRGLPLNSDSLRQIPLFAPTHTTLSKVHKTGLGSSAALITSLVSALFIHFGSSIGSSSSSTGAPHLDTKLLHNTAQFIHCLAQGKVGSGFDVSSAVWGSHTYRRFSPELLSPIMTQDSSPSSNQRDIPALLKVLDPTQTQWDNQVEPFKLAPGLHLMLADIDAGSHTPTLVSNVLKWRKNKPEEANTLWRHLGHANDTVVALLKQLDDVAKQHVEAYEKAIKKASVLPAAQWKNDLVADQDMTSELLIKIYEAFQTVREDLREMSRLSDVAVEPEEQTRLLDACLAVPGVLMAGVPGAGGFDAIFCIVLSDESRRAVETVWSNFTEMNVGPLLCKESVEGGLVVELGSQEPGQHHETERDLPEQIHILLSR